MNALPKMIIVSAPSGAGKTTIVNQLLKSGLRLEFSISATSRPIRGNEKDGVNYHYLTADEFRKKIGADEFLEWEEVYPDKFYGTLRSEVDRIAQKGNHVIFDVDVVGGVNLKEKFGDRAFSLFIMPPSIKILEERLNARQTDSRENIIIRLAKARTEMKYAEKFDATVVNDELEKSVSETISLISQFLES